MPGVFDPAPRRFGGQADRPGEIILESLLEGQGTAFTDDVGTHQWAERLAESRCIEYLWGLNRRMGNQWDPLRMTDFLPRWEKILGLTSISIDTPVSRRAKVAAKLAIYGERPTRQVLDDLLTAVLGAVYVGLVETPSSSTTGAAAVPGGCTIPGGVTLLDGDWHSSIAHVAIETMQPTSMSDLEFFETAGQITSFLDDLMAAWTTFDWFLDGTHGAGFYLDEDRNLDGERFD